MDKLKELIAKLKEKGLDLTFLMVQDVKTKEPSVTFTLFLINGVLALLSLFDKIKASESLGLNFQNTKDLLMVTGAMYLGRKFMSGDKSISKEGE